MPKSWPGYLPPLLAAAVTLMLTAVFAAATGGSESAGPLMGLVMLLLIPLPLAVAVIWGSVVLTSRPFQAAFVGAAVWLVLSWLLLPRDIVWQMAGNVATGLAAGLALGRGWRLDLALAVVAAALLPVIIWTVVQMPVSEQLQMISEQMLEVLEENLPPGASEQQRVLALAEEKRNLDRMSALAEKVYPFFIGVGLLGQGGIILALVLFTVRRLGLALPGWSLPRFSRWKLPFYTVWLLVLGVGLMLTRAPYLATTGLNLALFVACVLSVQGIAVQFHVTSRMLSKMGRLLYWLVMGFFFAPLIMAGGVVLGLVDQWFDLRRPGTGPGDEDGNVG
ncbi:MAG: DUF2232 domain-containing protein [Candidatus Krumholzibacteriota bacterium]